jgi:hypothetical protein
MRSLNRIIFGLLLVLSVFAMPFQTLAKSKRCPIPDPNTLRELYQSSDLILVGEIANSSLDKFTNEDEYGKSGFLRNNLTITEMVKGTSEKEVFFNEYVYLANKESQDEDSEKKVDDKVESRYETGKKYLFFLRKSEEDGGFELVDYQRGAKLLSDEDLIVYKARIADLAVILNQKKTDPQKLTAWFIKCIDEKATRWEGAFELYKSFETLKYEEEELSEIQQTDKNEGQDTEEEDTEEEVIEDFFVGHSVFAKSITEVDKRYLTSILVAIDSKDFSKNITSIYDVDGDKTLLKLVSKWGSKQAVEWLLPTIKSSGGDYSNQTGDYMQLVAEIFKDDKLSSLAEKYFENSSDEIEQQDVESVDTPIRAEDSENPTAETTDSKIPEEVSTENAVEVSPIKPTPAVDVKKIRERIIFDFSLRAESLLTKSAKAKKRK